MRQVYDWLNRIQFRLFPATCILCGAAGAADAPGIDLCTGCLAALPRVRHPCPCCGVPLEAPLGLCGPCRRRPPPFERVAAPFHYVAPVDHLIHRLKFGGRLAPARLLGELLAGHLAAADGTLPEAIVPVPLHRRRLRRRGYNQALELARPVARRLGLPLLPRAAFRHTATAEQSGLDARDRRRNVRGAFTVVAAVPGHVAVVDDVVTTGSTVAELTRTLHRAGVRRVEIWAVARA